MMSITEKVKRQTLQSMDETGLSMHSKRGTQVLNDQEIRNNYRFKLPVLVSQMESSTGNIHFTEGFQQSFAYL